jgi:hypothetical protein
MACAFCQSVKQSRFPAEINIHFPGLEGLNKPTVWTFPCLLVCLDCGCTQFTIGESELQQLNAPEHQSKGVAA